MNAFKKITVVVIMLTSLFSLLAQAKDKKLLSTHIKPKSVENNTPKKKYYFYNEATDAYIEKVISQSRKLWKNGNSDEAIALLVKEQARLDKKGLKVNLGGKFVKLPNGGIKRLQDGGKSDLPLASEDEVPRIPSPLKLTLMTIRMDGGQSPVEMVDYYQEISKKFKGNNNSIIAASQTVSLLGFNNEKSWEFINTTFDQTEKNLLLEDFIELAFTDSKLKISMENLSLALKQISPEHVPDNLCKQFSSLGQIQRDTIESQFWEFCPQWTDYNVQNRLNKASQFRNNKEYTDTYNLYETILKRYKNQKDIFDKVQDICIEAQFEQALWCRTKHDYSQANELYNVILKRYPEQKLLPDRIRYNRLENQIEEVFCTTKKYSQCSQILNEYKDLFEKQSEFNQNSNTVKVLCGIFSGNNEQAGNIIQEQNLPSQLFSDSRIVSMLSTEQRMQLDDFAWGHCLQWQDYNFQRQFSYALYNFQLDKYSKSLHFWDRLYRRYKKKFSQEMLVKHAKTAIRAGKTNSAIAILEPLLVENTALKNVEAQYYLTYAYILEGKHKESDQILEQMKREYPKSLYTLKMSYLTQQKEWLQRTFKFTRTDQIDGLLKKASECFDDGELEKAIGIYLRIFVEYPERQDVSYKACYFLGYYYLLSGDFEMANGVLKLLKDHFKASSYATQADLLIHRIKDLTTL